MKRKYQSKQLMAIHESARDLYEIGLIDTDKMWEFDEVCLVEEEDKEAVGEIATVETE
ncbi:MAG: hypothetical protein LBP19_07975 [Treponema sp.]|jgi:DNA-binding transcriptional regulator YiaG|nr:hypothetical protein [Treponema sp.]